MKIKKGLRFSLVALLGVFCAWYFFFKEYDYKITFTNTQAPGIIYQHVFEWNNWEKPKHKVVHVRHKIPFSYINQRLEINDSLIDIKWNFERMNDSVTKVSVFLKDSKHSLKQKLLIPFIETDFKKHSLNILKKIREDIILHKNEYKLSSVVEANLESVFCLYYSIKCEADKKADNMIMNNSYIMDFITSNNLELLNNPFVEVTDWDIEKDSLSFDFCFPIKEVDSLPVSKEFKFKYTEPKKSLKISFNGNYKFSDKGWYQIIDYAERNNIKIDSLPIEIYKNDPHAGGNELDWVAEIYMPIKT